MQTLSSWDTAPAPTHERTHTQPVFFTELTASLNSEQPHPAREGKRKSLFPPLSSFSLSLSLSLTHAYAHTHACT